MRTLYLVILIILGFLSPSDSIYSQSYTLNEKDSILRRIEQLNGKEKFDLEVEFFEAIFSEFPEKGDAILEDINQFSALSDTTDKLWAKLVNAQFQLLIRDYQSCISLATEVKQNFHALPIQKFRATYMLRTCYSDLDALDKALEAHQDLNWKLNPNNWESLVPEYFNSEIYFKFREYDKAIDLLKLSIKEIDKSQYDYWKMSLRNSLGVYFEHANELDSAIKYYNEALSILTTTYVVNRDFSEAEYNFISGLFQGNIGQSLMKKGQFKDALPLLMQDVEGSSTQTSHNIYKENLLISNIHLAECLIQLKRINEVQNVLASIRELSKFDFLHKHLGDIENIYFLYYDAIGNTEEAIKHLKRSVILKDSLLELENTDKARNLNIAYEAGLQEERLISKNEALEELQEENKNQATMILAISIIGVLFIGLFVFLFISYRSKQKNERKLMLQNEQIEQQKSLLTQALTEKEILFKEVNHRVKNNLQIVSSLLYFQAKIVKDEAAKKAMKDAQSRVLSMSFIHQKLYQTEDVGVIDFQNYISSLAEHICRNTNVQNIHIELSIDANKVNISVQKAIPLGLVLHELVTNSVKHAFGDNKNGSISIRFEQDQNMLHLFYSDSGNGEKLEETFDSPTIGKKLIFLLTSQLNGSISQKENHLNEIHFSFKLA